MRDRSGDGAETPDPIANERLVSLRCDEALGINRLRCYAFDTDVELTFRDEDGEHAADVAARAVEALRTYERMFSRFLPHSDVSRINAAHGTPVTVARETYELLQVALAFCECSWGTFDVTVGTASRLWNYRRGRVPDKGKVDEARSHVGWRNMLLLGQNVDGTGVVRMADPVCEIDLGGVAKGYIADRLSECLEQEGLSSHLINLGGNVLARGTRDGFHGWRVALPASRDTGSAGEVVEVEDLAVVTSGTDERCFTQDGTRYHHIIDPRTCRPAETDLASAAVFAHTATDAEGYSTTLLMLGSTRASAFAREHPEIRAVRLVTASGEVVSYRRES